MSVARALEIYGREHAPHVAAPRIIGFAIDALLPFWGDLPVSVFFSAFAVCLVTSCCRLDAPVEDDPDRALSDPFA
jgi:hypothetical protein